MLLGRTRVLFGVLLLFAVMLLAPGDLNAQQYLKRLIGIEAPAARPAPEAEREQMLRDSVVAMARSQIGRRYRWGGERPEEGFDCSGLVRYIMSAFDLSLPRTAHLQSRIGREVPRDPDQLKPGDVLTFGTSSRITHVGIYVGDGRIVHASSGSGRVVESPVIRRWHGVRRLLGWDEGIRVSPG